MEDTTKHEHSYQTQTKNILFLLAFLIFFQLTSYHYHVLADNAEASPEKNKTKKQNTTLNNWEGLLYLLNYFVHCMVLFYTHHRLFFIHVKQVFSWPFINLISRSLTSKIELRKCINYQRERYL